jgi:DNA-binding MarR family transcriptional regulator
MCRYQHHHNFPPSLREIERSCFVSRTTVLRYLDQMQMRGWISRELYKARGITLLKPCDDDE